MSTLLVKFLVEVYYIEINTRIFRQRFSTNVLGDLELSTHQVRSSLSEILHSIAGLSHFLFLPQFEAAIRTPLQTLCNHGPLCKADVEQGVTMLCSR